eukprot:m.426640 g.426640  ORF g.426640 m.426640 type:complete len:135 (-) comp20222_c11_seq7:137-541(-)
MGLERRNGGRNGSHNAGRCDGFCSEDMVLHLLLVAPSYITCSEDMVLHLLRVHHLLLVLQWCDVATLFEALRLTCTLPGPSETAAGVSSSWGVVELQPGLYAGVGDNRRWGGCGGCGGCGGGHGEMMFAVMTEK